MDKAICNPALTKIENTTHRTYRKPRLVAYGTVQLLTQNTTMSKDMDDNPGMGGSDKTG